MSAAEVLAVAFDALSPDDQEDAYGRISESRLRRLASEETIVGRMIGSLLRVQERVGRVPTVDDYREQYKLLKGTQAEIEEPSRLIRHFGGSWRQVKEALSLAETTTARKVDARLRSRRLGKVHRYSEETLRDCIERAADFYSEREDLDYRRAISAAEYAWWRERELELAAAHGDDSLHLPGNTVFWKRYGRGGVGWAGVLRHFGWHDDEIERCLDATAGRFGTKTGPRRPNDYSDDDLRDALHCAADAYSETEGLDYRRAISMSEYEAWRREELKRAGTAKVMPHIPGYNVFRTRFGPPADGWAGVLRHFGWSAKEIDRRLEELSGRFGTPSAPQRAMAGRCRPPRVAPGAVPGSRDEGRAPGRADLTTRGSRQAVLSRPGGGGISRTPNAGSRTSMPGSCGWPARSRAQANSTSTSGFSSLGS